MIHTKLRFGCVRASLMTLALLALSACGGGGGGGGASNGGGNPGGGSNASDTTPPDTIIATKPDAVTKSTTASFTFSSSESGSSFEVSVDGAPFAASGASLDLASVTEGQHSLSVRAIDTAKNADATPATATWRVDLTAPTAQVFFPPAHSYTDTNQVTLRGKVTDPSGSSLKVNGIDVTVAADGTWSSVQPVAVGENTFVVSANDTLGNAAASAATVHVTNNGPAMSFVRGMDLDAVHHRLLLADYERRQILALDLTNGQFSVFAAYDQTSASPLFGVSSLAVDAANNRVIAVDVLTDQLTAIDLTTGTRTAISDASKSTSGSTNFVAVASDLTGIVLDMPNHAAYVTRASDPSSSAPAGILKIDLQTGTRDVVTGSQIGGLTVGAGPPILQSRDLVLDTSTSPARLLVAHNQREILAVNSVTGERTTFSNDSVGSGPAIGLVTRMRLDPTHGRVLVTSGGPNRPHGVFAVNLSNADRTQLIDTSSANEPYGGAFLLALDSVNSFVYLANFPTTEIYRADLAGGTPSLIAHNNVGGGYKVTSIRNVAQVGDTLYFMEGGVGPLIKFDLATSDRVIVSGNGVGSGGTIGFFDSFCIDEENHRALVPDLLMGALWAIDLQSGNRTVLSSNSVGSGPPLQRPSKVVWDAVGKRALVADESNNNHAFFLAIDEQGNRTAALADLQYRAPPVSVGDLVLDPATNVQAAHVTALLDSQLFDVNFDTGVIARYSSTQFNDLWMYPKEHVLLMTDGRGVLRYDFANAPQLVSGRSNSSSIGAGVDMLYPNSVIADADKNVAYVTDLLNYGVMAVDLSTGERVLISR
jgi:sugar lactone lactonase YvrE